MIVKFTATAVNDDNSLCRAVFQGIRSRYVTPKALMNLMHQDCGVDCSYRKRVNNQRIKLIASNILGGGAKYPYCASYIAIHILKGIIIAGVITETYCIS